MFVIGKFLLNLTPAINIIRFIIHGFLRNYALERKKFFFLILIHFCESQGSGWSYIIKSFISAWSWCYYYLGDAIVCYVNDDINVLNNHCDGCEDKGIHIQG